MQKKSNQKSNPANSAKSNLIKINLSPELQKKLNAMDLKEKSSFHSREDLIYNYPPAWGKREIGGIEGKNFRGNCRNRILNFSDRILLFAKMNRIEDLNSEMKLFFAFYKEKYKLNDFSILPFGRLEEGKRERIALLLEIAKKFNPASNKGIKSPAKGIASKGKDNAGKGIIKDINKKFRKGKDSSPLKKSFEESKSENINPASDEIKSNS